MAHLLESTYRLQFHAGFTFDQAAEIAGYLRDLGVTHAYASPYLAARAGSTHGYDVVDHTRVNPELGGQEGLSRWIRALSQAGLSHILDVVPNHAGVATNENAWWNDVLEHGRASRYADFFDIAWRGSPRQDLRDKVLLPVLGDHYAEVLGKGELRLAWDEGAFSISYYDRRFPVDPATYPQILRCGFSDGVPQELELIVREFDRLSSIAKDAGSTPADRYARTNELKRRLSVLAGADVNVRNGVEGCIAMFNGETGSAESGRGRFDLLDDLLSRQHYLLSYWRIASDDINYRRFFDINDLAALRMELPDVFEESHELIFRLLRDGELSGLRVDHPDGLYDPLQYFRRLQERYARSVGTEGGPLYVVVEKILAAGEPLPAGWPVSGTSGYDFLNVINGLFIDREAEDSLTRLYARVAGNNDSFATISYQKKLLILDTSLAGDLAALAREVTQLAQSHRGSRDLTHHCIAAALRAIIACFPIYRTYVSPEGVNDADRATIDSAIEEAAKRSRGIDPAVFTFIHDVLTLSISGLDESRRSRALHIAAKFQQLSAPVMAKGVEDTAFYIYNRLISLNEVGGDPGRFGISSEQVHQYLADRQVRWPRALSCLSTHDTKRSEDSRARINVLPEIAGEWVEHVTRWMEINNACRDSMGGRPAPDANEEYLLYQTLIGAWPIEPCSADDYAAFGKRVAQFMQKAMREAKIHTSWTDSAAEYEAAVEGFVERILDPRRSAAFHSDFRPFQSRISHWGMLNSLSQTLLRIAAPGAADTYQGSELWDFSMVDPDNRRPVDYKLRRTLLAGLAARLDAPGADRRAIAQELVEQKDDARVKLYVTSQALNARRDRPGLFADGEYLPAQISGQHRQHVFAFARQSGAQSALIVVPRLIARLTPEPGKLPAGEAVWSDTTLNIRGLGKGLRMRNVFTGELVSLQADPRGAIMRVADALAVFPIALFVSET